MLDPTTKALQDIAKQLKRIADYLQHDQHLGDVYNIHVDNGTGIHTGGATVLQVKQELQQDKHAHLISHR